LTKHAGSPGTTIEFVERVREAYGVDLEGQCSEQEVQRALAAMSVMREPGFAGANA
jgi:hypothetical protein